MIRKKAVKSMWEGNYWTGAEKICCCDKCLSDIYSLDTVYTANNTILEVLCEKCFLELYNEADGYKKGLFDKTFKRQPAYMIIE